MDDGLAEESSSFFTALNCHISELVLDNNRIHGVLPRAFGHLDRLTKFSIDNNDLVGTVPNEFADLTRLREFSVRNNNLNGGWLKWGSRGTLIC